ncbi:hypothetical protein Q8A67_020588 [Cirrhinus molitorella]|uniref:Uncharacterized protein n=1 Tax=Cirrhinus molitorella TaxID=172907 RepID=A0AA88P809_9TELE|nr:hypothetical protein Q8A67_020588 [Cirrhinus molitorella]
MDCAQELKRDTDSSDRGLEVIFPLPRSLPLYSHIKRGSRTEDIPITFTKRGISAIIFSKCAIVQRG